MANLLVLVMLAASIVGLHLFFEGFHKVFPWAGEGNNGLKIWAVIFFVLVPLLAVLTSNR